MTAEFGDNIAVIYLITVLEMTVYLHFGVKNGEHA